MTDWVLQIVQGGVYLLLAPLVVGVLHWARARLQGRQGPSVLQVYRDLPKLWQRQPVIPDTASWVFLAAPGVVFMSYALLGFLVPVFYLPAEGHWILGDLLLIVYVLGLARLAVGLAGMDAGAPFGGLGSSRELFVHVLAEPTLILVVFVLALQWRTTDLVSVITTMHSVAWHELYTSPSLLLLMLALVLVTLIEAGRLPYDNPDSHLELTMFGKAVHLEYGGPQLALLEWAEALRLTFFLTLLLNLLMPRLLAMAGGGAEENLALALLYPGKLCALVLVLALWESVQVKLRLRAIVTPALTALAMALIAAILILVGPPAI